MQDLNAIAVGCGPVSFTGIRLSCSIAQGLAFSNDLKTIQVSSLEVLARNINAQLGAERIVSIVDARMQQLYVGEFLYSKEVLVTSNTFVVPVEKFKLSAYEETSFFVGDGCNPIENQLKEISKNIFLNLPLATDLPAIATDKYFNTELLEPAELLPIYLFGEEQWKTTK